MAASVGIDPVRVGIMAALSRGIGLPALPFYLRMMATLIPVAFFPGISLLLPGLFMGCGG